MYFTTTRATLITG